jgi:hypothetical protein
MSRGEPALPTIMLTETGADTDVPYSGAKRAVKEKARATT